MLAWHVSDSVVLTKGKVVENAEYGWSRCIRLQSQISQRHAAGLKIPELYDTSEESTTVEY
jgi:hypothetical protein